MDIFTTQLTRVVPVKIKTEQLKVKALVKDAAASKLSDDTDHLENHDYYFHDSRQQNAQEKLTEQQEKAQEQREDVSSKENLDEDGKPHLDIYV